MIAFGPIPSRRLGRSLGINHIPPKTCTYACVYCQVGRTTRMSLERQSFYEPELILDEVRTRVEQVRAAGERIDYLTFVADGEPTLDLDLGREIEMLRPLGLPIAVITNGSLIHREDVRADLARADWVSLKVDALREPIWRRINRPHRRLELAVILDAMLEFARSYRGKLVSETMLVEDVHNPAACSEDHLEEVAAFLARLAPATAYLSIPTRPPTEAWVHAPDEATIHRAYQILDRRVERVELLVGYEGDAFACTGDAERDLLSITAVHPMREEAVHALLDRAGADWSLVQDLIERDQLVEIQYAGARFYMRKLASRRA